MSAANDHVLVQLAIDSTGLARQGFGEMGILSHKATSQKSWSERIRRYKSLAAAVPGDWAADSPEGLAIAAAFAQSPKPISVAVIRAIGTLTQRYDIAVIAATAGQTYAFTVDGEGVTSTVVSYLALANLSFVDADVNTTSDAIAETAHGMTTGNGPYRLSNTGGALPGGTAVDTNYWIIVVDADHYKLASSKANALANTPVNITSASGAGTHTLLRATNDVIIAQLLQQANAVTGANYTATQVAGTGDTDTLRLTGNAVNNWFSVAIASPLFLSCAQSHAAPSDVSLATDIANILLSDAGWFTLITLYNSPAYVLAAAAACESNDRLYFADSCDSDNETMALSGGTDIGSQLFALGYKNTMECFYPRPQRMLSARIGGRWLSTDPGKATAKFKTLSGIEGLTNLTDTYKTNLRDKRVNTYEQVLADRPFFWEGSVFSTTNKFIDVTRNAFFAQDVVQKRLLGVFVGNDIVPFTPAGIVLMEGAMRQAGEELEAAGVLAPGWTVQVPVFEDISDADKEDRNLRNLTLQGALAGAIHKAIPVNIVLTF